MEKYKVILADGHIIEDLELNGNNYISRTELTEDIFKNNLAPVIITGPEELEELHPRMKLIQLMQYGNEYWFILDDISEREISEAKLRADVEYLAMMTDVEL